jgi:hypothetical protein
MPRGDVRAAPAVTMWNDLPDDILLEHVFPKLSLSDRGVFANVHSRTRTLVQREVQALNPKP